MNYCDETKVAYETGPKETPERKKRKNTEFPGDVMEQGNKTARGKDYVEKKYPANPTIRHGEYR